MRLWLAFFAAVLLINAAFGDPKSYYYKRWVEKETGFRLDKMLESRIFEQRLNHDDPSDTRTFKQRYYLDKTYASGDDAPVLFFLCGEATCTELDLQGAVRTHASKHKAVLVALEHRYYGESQPFDQLTTENMAFLSTANALKDAAAFQRYAQKELKLNGKWIAVGGSYPGSLAAYYRSVYPDLAVGALSSSGPVQAKENFEEYDRHVAKVAGPACLGQIKKVVAQLDAALNDSKALEDLKKKFDAEVLVDPLDFVYLVADMAALAIQYGYRDHFCKLLESETPVDGYATFTREIYASWGINALSSSAQGALSLNWKDYLKDFGLRQWFYQSCTEYGYWQNAYHDEALSARSHWVNPEYHQNLCKRLFGITKPVNTDVINRELYEPLLKSVTSRILFTNGAQDPWSNLSITQENGNATNPNTIALTIAGAAHCDDLRRPKTSDSEAVKKARQLFSDLATEWFGRP